MRDLKAKDVQLEQYKNERNKANDDLAGEQAKFQGERGRMNDERDKLNGDLVAARKEINDIRDKAKTDEQAAKVVIEKLKSQVTDQGEIIKGYTSEKVGTPSGEITWVNQRNSTVWINLGRADSLTRQVSFSVFPPDVTSMTDKAAKKAKIEVTQILGDHLAEARVVDDDPGNPDLAGRQDLYAALEFRREAAFRAGRPDGHRRRRPQRPADGAESHRHQRRRGRLLHHRCRQDQSAQINVNTSCLILGDAPTERSGSAQRDAFTKIQHDADQLRLEKMQLTDLLQRMGWKNMSPVIRYGRGANPKDFRAKPDEGVQRKSTGNVTDLFKKRQPPKAPASAY